jgi:hypothetical protein
VWTEGKHFFPTMAAMHNKAHDFLDDLNSIVKGSLTFEKIPKRHETEIQLLQWTELQCGDVRASEKCWCAPHRQGWVFRLSLEHLAMI